MDWSIITDGFWLLTSVPMWQQSSDRLTRADFRSMRGAQTPKHEPVIRKCVNKGRKVWGVHRFAATSLSESVIPEFKDNRSSFMQSDAK